MAEARSVALNLSSRELIFLQKVTRQEYHFITDEEQEARLRLRDKLMEGFFDQNESRVVLTLTRDELLFLIKVARENYSFIVRAEKEARLALAARPPAAAATAVGLALVTACPLRRDQARGDSEPQVSAHRDVSSASPAGVCPSAARSWSRATPSP